MARPSSSSASASAAVSVRTLRGADLPAVLEIWNRTLLRDPINETRLVTSVYGDADFWPGEDSGFFVAERGGRPVGFLRAIIRRMPNDRIGIEPEEGWVPYAAVAPEHQHQGVGRKLLEAALAWLRGHGRRHVWVCGGSGSAPGYIFPGVDVDAYPGGLALLRGAGFTVHRESVGMSREVIHWDHEAYVRQAWGEGGVRIEGGGVRIEDRGVSGGDAATAAGDVRVETLTPQRIGEFIDFLAAAFPGDWNTAARGKIAAGAWHEILVATVGGTPGATIGGTPGATAGAGAGGRMVGYCQWSGEHFGPFGVAEAARSKGIGAKLFVEAVRRIRAADGRTVWFNWAEKDAERFYARFGLKATRRFAIMECRL